MIKVARHSGHVHTVVSAEGGYRNQYLGAGEVEGFSQPKVESEVKVIEFKLPQVNNF